MERLKLEVKAYCGIQREFFAMSPFSTIEEQYWEANMIGRVKASIGVANRKMGGASQRHNLFVSLCLLSFSI